MEIGVFPDCNAHRNLAYAVQQIIAQELEVERLKRTSINLTGLGGVNSENVANLGKPEIMESDQNRSSNLPNNTKQSEKNVTFKEMVSFIYFFFMVYDGNLIILNNFRCTKIFSEILLRMNMKVLRNKIK